MAATPDPLLSRRTLLAGLGGALMLGACSSTGVTPGAGGSAVPAPTKLNLIPRFDPNAYAEAGVAQRLVMSVVTSSNDTPKDLPGTLSFTVTRKGPDGGEIPVAESLATALHQDGIPAPYFPVRFTPDQFGTYRIKTTVNGTEVATVFAVQASGKVGLPLVGQKLKATDTPTTDNSRGVKPICTRERDGKKAFCPFHSVNLRDALAAARPVALLVSTPAFCQIGVCGPVLELVTEKAAAYPGVQFIHAEVYTDPKSGSQQTAPIVNDLGIDFEPALFLVTADGTLVEQLSHVFDRVEIAAGLDKLL